jgi:hypothetical protein
MIGPFLQYEGRDVTLNDDGSTAMLIWKDEPHTTAQIVATDTNGILCLRVDCDPVVDGPLVAPNGAGVLVHPNTGGRDQNTFQWHTAQGKAAALDLSPNPRCVGWVPSSRLSLFLSGPGWGTRYRLIDWDTGNTRWDISGPTNREVLSVGFTPQFILFETAELYQSGPWRGSAWRPGNGGQECLRTFEAVSVQDGRVAARWQAQPPQRLAGEERDHFLTLNGRLYFVTAGECVELNTEDIRLKKNGWQ